MFFFILLIFFPFYCYIYGVGIRVLIMNGIRLTNEEATARINERCNDLNYVFLGFDNEDNVYTNNKVKLKLHCNKCGSEWNTTSYEKFMCGRNGCPGCNPKKKQNEKEIVKQIKERCKELDYKFLGFVGNYTSKKVTQINLKCRKCGAEWDTTTVSNFLRDDRNSHKCWRKNPSNMPSNLNAKNAEYKIAKKLSGSSLEFVSFDNSEYLGSEKTKVVLKCKECGEYSTVSMHNLLYSTTDVPQCIKCQYNGKVSNEEAIEKIKHKCELLEYEFLGFDNPKNKYDGKETKLILKCLKCGYIWKTTTYANFMYKAIKCRGCTNNWHLERTVECYLKEAGIPYEIQKRFDWLKNKINMTLDFYLPDYDIGIECQGRQHFIPVDKFGGEEGFKDTQIRDALKKNQCEKHKIKILYFTELKKYNNFIGETLVKTKDKLVESIEKYGRR